MIHRMTTHLGSHGNRVVSLPTMGLGNGYEDGDMQLTAESTIADDQERARREGSVLWAKTKPLLDKAERADALEAQVQELQAELEQTKAAPVDRMQHARDSRTEDKQALCNRAITDTLAWLEARGAHVRVSHVLEHLKDNQDIYKYSELPSRRYIKKMLKAIGL